MCNQRPVSFPCLISVISTALVLLLTSAAFAAKSEKEQLEERHIVARWHITGEGQFEEAHRRGLDVWDENLNPRAPYFTVMLSDSELARLESAGYQLEIVDPDYYKTLQERVAVPNGGFKTYDECYEYMDMLHMAHLSITTAVFSIGTTVEGRDMWAIKVSDNPNVDEDEPEVMFDGMHHAREPIGMEICLETLRQLTEGYGVDTMITRLVNEREIYFVPIVNPDGYEWNRVNYPGGGGSWRRNRRNNGNLTWGVDLNRNYGYQWGYDDLGSSPVPGAEDYRGTAAFSEPETQNMRNFINSHHFVFVLNYHSFSNLFMWPWCYEEIYSPDDRLLAAIGDSAVTFNGFIPEVGWKLYVTNGDADDWNYGATSEHARILSMTPEVGTTVEGGFWPIPANIPIQVAECQGPNLLLINLADSPERILPPAIPTWESPGDTVIGSDYTLQWSDPGGLNGAATYKLDELFGPHTIQDDAESGLSEWIARGFTASTDHAVSGTHSFYGGTGDVRQNRLTTAHYYRVAANDTLKLKVWYDIQTDYDYAYVEISTDTGASFTPLAGNITTNNNPRGGNRGNGITGSSGGSFVDAAFPLSSFIGQQVLFRLSYETDLYLTGAGIYFDDVRPICTYDSVVTLAAATSATTYLVSGGNTGLHDYQLTATDLQGQRSRPAPAKTVSVFLLNRGDMNNDQTRDVIDVVLLIDHVFRGAQGPVLAGAEECNCVPGVDVMDVVMLIDHVFRDGPEPICP